MAVERARRRWLLLDNDGNYGGHFGAVPRHLRVGPWSPVAWIFILGGWIALLTSVPKLHFTPPTADFTWLEPLIFGWGVAAIAHGSLEMHPAVFTISYTGWSWLLLTTHAACAVVAAALPPSAAAFLLWLREVVRFPTAIGASVTTFWWNMFLCPLIYFRFCSTRKERRKFMDWNFSFVMTSVHVCNLPLAWLSIHGGAVIHGGATAARPMGPHDLWVAGLILFCYVSMYVFVLDRYGLHLYCMFSPRSQWCVVFYGLILGTYYFFFKQWGGTL